MQLALQNALNLFVLGDEDFQNLKQRCRSVKQKIYCCTDPDQIPAAALGIPCPYFCPCK
jgi:hypothetical protein